MGRGLYEGPPEIKTPGAWCDADDLRPSDFKKLAVAEGAGGFLASDAGQQFASCQALAEPLDRGDSARTIGRWYSWALTCG